jgi:hypothetical protein
MCERFDLIVDSESPSDRHFIAADESISVVTADTLGGFSIRFNAISGYIDRFALDDDRPDKCSSS